MTALDALIALFTQFGLADLASQIGELAGDPDLTDAEKFAAVYKLPAYQERFPAMAELQRRGEVMDEATYINQEAQYRAVLKNAGLPEGFYDSRQSFADWMLGAVSPAELEARIGRAQRIVESSDTNLLTAARDYYGLDKGTLLAYVIDADKAQPLIDRQIKAIEAGAAASRYQFQIDRAAAEALVTDPLVENLDPVSMRQRFASARDLAEQDTRLSSIEGTDYTDTEALDAVIRGDRKAQLASQRRAEREAARFSGSSGFGRGSLKTSG